MSLQVYRKGFLLFSRIIRYSTTWMELLHFNQLCTAASRFQRKEENRLLIETHGHMENSMDNWHLCSVFHINVASIRFWGFYNSYYEENECISFHGNPSNSGSDLRASSEHLMQ